MDVEVILASAFIEAIYQPHFCPVCPAAVLDAAVFVLVCGGSGDVLPGDCKQEVALLQCHSTPHCVSAGFAQVFVFGVDSVLQSGEP